MYKIRHKETGLYSSGGAYPRWTKRGKVWYALHHIAAHLRLNSDHKKIFYGNAEIVYFQVSIDSVTTMSIEDVQ